MKNSLAHSAMVVLAMTVWGCAIPPDQRLARENVKGEPPNNNTSHREGATQSLAVSGTIQGSDKGNSDVGLAGQDILAKAVKLIVSAVDPTGKLLPVGEGQIFPGGAYQFTIDSNNPVALYIVSVVDIGNSVIGSAVLNGIPAFATGFLVDIPIDTLTSFKTEVIMTMLKSGVPGAQNYLNVVNTFVEDELAGWLVVGSAFVSDFNAIVGSVARSAIAAQNVMFALLEAGGLPVDLSKISDAELAVVTGYTGLVSNANGQVFTTTKNLLMALEEATSKGAAPIDKLLFNAVIGGSAMFKSTLKSLLPAQMGGGFAVSKSSFKLEAMASLETIEKLFTAEKVNPKVAEAVKSACEMFRTNIQQAKATKDLTDAKAAFYDMLLGKQTTASGNVIQLLTSVATTLQQALDNLATELDPVAKDLATSLNAPSLTVQDISKALAKFDMSTNDVATDLKQALSPKEAEVLADALKTTAKVFLP